MRQRSARTIKEWWLSSKVDLAAGETMLERGYFWYRVWWWQWTRGGLYLTTDRLIWIRQTLTLPIGPRLIEIALQQIKAYEKRRPPVNWQNALLVEETDGQRHWFSPLPWKEDIDGWIERISGVLGGVKSE